MSGIPVILFAYNRPDHLRRTLDCLRANQVPLIYAFSDGPRTPDTSPLISQVRDMLKSIDWCEVVLCERENNLGLGRSIRTGVTEVLGKHEAAIIVEDDLICVPGTYAYLSAALEQYREYPQVMSVTGWTHPKITPPDITDQPYFDGRAECWIWGTWARAWQGMDEDAKALIQRCNDKGIDEYRYGADLPVQAGIELEKNIWAVRFLYWHIVNQGLCLRPPWSMVEHIGFDFRASNAQSAGWLESAPPQSAPSIPRQWPEPVENPACAQLHRKVCGGRPTVRNDLYRLARQMVSRTLGSNSLLRGLRR